MMIGPVIFFPLTAIQSVPFMIIAICLAIRGLVIAPEKKGLFTLLLVFYGIHFITFFYAIMNYTWMGIGGGTAYDSAYHFFGLFSSIIFLIIAQQVAASTSTEWKKSPSSKIYLGCWAYQVLGAALLFGVTNDTLIIVRIFYAVYALLQIIVPIVIYSTMLKDERKHLTWRPQIVNPISSAALSAAPPARKPNPFLTEQHATPADKQPPTTQTTE